MGPWPRPVQALAALAGLVKAEGGVRAPPSFHIQPLSPATSGSGRLGLRAQDVKVNHPVRLQVEVRHRVDEQRSAVRTRGILPV